MNYTALSIHGNRIPVGLFWYLPRNLEPFPIQAPPLIKRKSSLPAGEPPPTVRCRRPRFLLRVRRDSNAEQSKRSTCAQKHHRYHVSNNNSRSPLRSPSPITPAHVPYRSLLLRQARFPCGEADHLSAAGSGHSSFTPMSLAARLQTTV